ncbi:MAG: pilus assembly protein [Chloroflexi bacterium]|nr:pilus assembly protein [Chloroflexota bacterium]MBU1747871.1 pilus assembly protein [Chloroflexota bacterium]
MWRRFRHSERGQAYLEFILLLPVVLLLIAGVIFFGRVLYVKVALDNAAYDGVRAGIESLSAGREHEQATLAARSTLAGYNIDPRPAQVHVGGYLGGRGNRLYCQVQYNIDVGDILFLEVFYPDLSVPLSATAYGQIEKHKSRWSN